MIYAICAVVWVVCGIFAYGITLAFFRGEFLSLAKEGRRENMGIAAFYGLLGPFGLVISLLASGFAKHGLKFK